jgi:hypothetical protein
VTASKEEDMDNAGEGPDADADEASSDELVTWEVDEGWALVVATDQDAEAGVIHTKLRAAGLDAYIRDVDPECLEEGQLPIQVIVPVEEAAAAILELDIALSIAAAKEDAGDVDRLTELGFEVDDLVIAELAATGGPVYGLDEFGDDDDEIRDFLRILEIERVRFALDRAANLVVHHNDEVKVDSIIDRLFASDDETESTAAATHSTADIDGRPVADDMTPDATIIPAGGTPTWAFAVAAVAVVVLAIVLLL